MKFCSQCAHPVTLDIPPDDHLPRHICPNCGTIHYQNPKLVVCSIPVWETDGETKIMLCRRAIEPRSGLWTLPGGFMENDETTVDAARRETVEEAGARIDVEQRLFSLINLPPIHQVHLFYRAKLLDLDFKPGAESLEVKLFSETDMPWSDLAFRSVRSALEFFFADLTQVRRGGAFGFHPHDILEPHYPQRFTDAR
ncbi:MAG: NUDIX hydrolase [Burkholderiaceae bacterium]|nr:NUDIX hydrolase [Burkholderiaceae bacterium]